MQSGHLDQISGIYLHVPFCESKCFYCAFYSTSYTHQKADAWLKALAAETAPWHGVKPKTVYIGGGTPSILSLRQWHHLTDLLQDKFDLQSIVEWSVEANPGLLSKNILDFMLKAGVTRISIGAQSFHASELKRLGRRHTPEDIRSAVQAVRSAGFTNFNLDLLAGIPGCSLDQWHYTLQTALSLNPAHISVYALTYEEGTRLARLSDLKQALPLEEEHQLKALDYAAEILSAHGYRRYEISNYALSGYACRHNLDCWRGKLYLGFGPAAASHVGLTRWQNLPDLQTYLNKLRDGLTPQIGKETLTQQVKKTEQLIFGLRLASGVSDRYVNSRQTELLNNMAASDLAYRHRKRWQLSKTGINVSDAIATELLD